MNRQTSRGRPLAVILVAGFALMAIGWLVVRGRATDGGTVAPAPPRAPAAGEGPTAGGGAAPMGAPAVAPETAAALRRCLAQWEPLRAERRRAEREHLLLIPLDRLFGRGSPNPRAQAALAPLVEAALAKHPGTIAGHSLECTSYACRLTVLVAKGAAFSFDSAVADDPDISQRSRASTFGFGGDLSRVENLAFSRESVEVYTAYLALEDAAGGAVSDQEAERRRSSTSVESTMPRGAVHQADLAGPPPPTSLESCQAATAALDGELEAVRKEARAQWPAQRVFAAGEPNAALTGRVGEALGRMARAAPALSSVSVDCRDQICRFTAEGGMKSRDWDPVRRALPHELMKGETGPGRFTWTMAEGKLLLDMRPRDNDGR